MIARFIDERDNPERYQETTNPPRSKYTAKDFKVGEIWAAYYPYKEQAKWKWHPAVILKVDENKTTVLSIRTTHDSDDKPLDTKRELKLLFWKQSGMDKSSRFVLDSVMEVDTSLFEEQISKVADFDWIALRKRLAEQGIDIPKSIHF